MTTKRVVTLVCDLCGSEQEGEVETHSVQIDRERVELEACSKCWTKTDKALAKIFEVGRKRRAAALKSA